LKHTILIVEDEKEIADTLTYALSSEGFETIWLNSGESLVETITSRAIDLCLLDIGLPDSNGFELLKTIRLSGAELPVIFLTARSEEIDRILGLELGADDYVCKPFSPREVVARVKVVLKRVDKYGVGETSDNRGVFEHRPEQRQIILHGRAVDLTRAEYQLMVAFIEQPSRVFSRRQLIDSIWSSNHPSDDRAIDTHIKTLRAKLKSYNPHKEFIVTHRGFGYSFEN
jgi:two-component system catabolic regulation response regulator CreB